MNSKPGPSGGRGGQDADPVREASVLPAMLDTQGVASALGVKERYVRRLVEERRIPFYKVGKFVRFRPAELEQWVAAKRVEQLRLW